MPDQASIPATGASRALTVSSVRCSVRSSDRGEALAGTASQVRRWLVVEQPGPWGREALLQSRFPADVAAALAARAKAAGVRVLLTRRPSWEHLDGPHRVHLASTHEAGGWVEQLDMDDPGALLDLPLERLGDPHPPGLGDPGPHPLLLVCTHGRHDACCANEGRPVVRSLVAAGVPDVWETSHVGGDRFAANLVALPWGVYLGRLRPEIAPAVAADLRAGLVDLGHYRGRSCHGGVVQAADLAVREATGERRVLGVQVDGNVEHRTDQGGSELAVVRLRVDDVVWEAEVRRWRGEPTVLTCGADPSRPWLHEVVALREC